ITTGHPNLKNLNHKTLIIRNDFLSDQVAAQNRKNTQTIIGNEKTGMVQRIMGILIFLPNCNKSNLGLFLRI
ncbi:hypothetical protein, partial [Mariniphaga sp.]|uniref:hypothetical protein n=1 Tax=Mariniphaga sp. TaxID=1954475 RepID=UPI003561F007